MELIDRFRYIMKLNQLSASAFADEIGVQRSSVSHVLSGRNKPSLEFIQKVLRTYPKVDANWLINGATQLESKQTPAEIDFSAGEESSAPKTAPKAEEVEQVTGNEEENEPSTHEKSSLKNKKVERIIVFYNDQTFETFQK